MRKFPHLLFVKVDELATNKRASVCRFYNKIGKKPPIAAELSSTAKMQLQVSVLFNKSNAISL